MLYPAAIARKTLELAPSLVDWLDHTLPSAHVRSVKLYSCDKLPFVGARYSGITLFNSIYLRCTLLPVDAKNLASIEVLLHELIHIEQYRRNRVFPLVYLFRLATHGYWNHPAEIEARERADALTSKFICEFPR